MKKTIAPLVLAALLVFHPTVQARSAASEWKTLYDETMALHQAGQYDRALVVAQQALRVAEQNGGPNHPSVATSLNNLAGLYAAQGDHARAEPLIRRALAIREKAFGPDHPAVAQSLENLAALYRATQRDTQAEPLEQRAAALRAIPR